MLEKIESLKISSLIPFKNHSFQRRDGLEQTELLESIRDNGVIEPLIVRPVVDGRYEIISGHRRTAACMEMGLATVPAIIKELSNDEAVIVMVDANLQREHLLPSEKAYAYKMKLEAIKHQGKSTSRQPVGKPESADQISETESGRQVQRYIRLTYLIPELLKMVDEGRIALTPAVELSYLPEREQKILVEEIEYTDATPSLSQAQRLRKLGENGWLSADTVFTVLNEEKPNQREQLRFMMEDIRKYFPKSYTSLDMQKTIIKLLEKWQRNRDRDAR